MKKLMTILVVFAMCGVAMADKPYDLSMGTKQVTETYIGWDWQEHTYTYNVSTPATYTYTNGEGTTGLSYTVERSKFLQNKADSQGVVYPRSYGNVYFTTTTNIPENKVLAVQFLGAEIEFGNAGSTYDANYKVQDYGIYLYDPETGNRTSDYLSVKNFNNYFGEDAGIKGGTTFGVYYVDNRGNLVASTGDGLEDGRNGWKNAENGMVGNFDDDSHKLKVYDPVTGEQTTKTTDKHFLCLSAGEYGEDNFRQTHWEFMLQTTLDNPYFPVNPNDFNNDVHVDDPVVDGVTGQPLPGTLATLLIGGLCAGSLRKRNKK